MIMTHIRTSLILAAGLLLTACGSATYVTSGSRVLIDSRYDAHPDSAAAAFIAPYKARVDSIMNPIVGYAATDMSCHQPESSQSNLYSDILVWSSSKFNEHPDFGVYNVGGIRAALSKGAVTVGDILDTAPFENKICFLTLSGDKVLELFRQITGQGGQGLSHSVRLVMDKHGRLLSAKINGRDVDPKRLLPHRNPRLHSSGQRQDGSFQGQDSRSLTAVGGEQRALPHHGLLPDNDERGPESGIEASKAVSL